MSQDVPVQNPSLTGATVTYAACANGDQVINNGRTFIAVKNGDGSSHTVTVTCVGACSFGSATPTHDLVVTVPASGEKLIGPFDQTRFDEGTGRISLVYSALTSMTIAAFSAS